MSRTPRWRKQARRVLDEGIFKSVIASMTPLEVEHPHLITGSRARRIALGSGHSVGTVRVVVKAMVNSPRRADEGRYLLAEAKRRIGARENERIAAEREGR